MRIIVYCYHDPLLENDPVLPPGISELGQVYQDRAIAPPSEQKKRQTVQNLIGEKRPQWQQLLQDAQAMPPDYVLVRQLEDLGESLAEVSDRLSQLESLGISWITLEDWKQFQAAADAGATTNLSALEHHLQASSMNRLQALQQSQRSRRIRQGHARNRVKALPPPGKPPYGYRRSKNGYVIDRSTAPLAKEFFEQFLLYGSVRGAVRFLAKRYNKKIAVSTGQRWLTNPAYRGDLEYQDGRVVRDTHAAIISRDEAAQVDRLLRRNRRMPPRSASAPRSLAGLVVCNECQSSMTVTRVTAHNQQQEYLYLRPRTCPQRPKCGAIAYAEVLQTTIQRICEDLPRAVSNVELPDMTQFKQGIGGAIASKQAVINQMPGLIDSGILDQDTADLRTYTLRTEISALENKLSQLPPVDLQATAQAVSLPQFWLDLSESERRFYFREFIREIRLLRQDTGWELKLVFFFSP